MGEERLDSKDSFDVMNSEEIFGSSSTRRELLGNADDGESGYPFADAFIKYPYTQSNNNKWAIIFHIIGIGYMTLGLNVVCDAYFCEALTAMVEAWKIQEDVAGATFMAAGGSAPELFTSLMGVFIAQSDVGFGTIVGSAVFNVLFVIGCCGVVSAVPLALTWWPLFRDCTYYILGLLVLSICVWDDKVYLSEAIVLFLMYIGYCTIMYYNSDLESKVKARLNRGKVADESKAAEDPDTVTKVEEIAKGGGSSEEKKEGDGEKGGDEKPEGGEGEGGDDDDEPGNPFTEWYTNGEMSTSDRAMAFFSLPITGPLWITVADCTTDKWKKHFVLTFATSILWIAIYSYFLVWWATIVGDIVGIPTVVMGLTFLAAGTSIPDAISSMVMAKMGEGDMAVSSSIGSNVFDILVGLPVPWMLKTGIVCPLAGSGDGECFVRVLSPFLVINVLVLLFMVVALVVSIHMNGWVLTHHLAFVYVFLYAIFLAIAIGIETSKPSSLNKNNW